MNIILLFLASITCAAGRTSMPVLQLLQAGQVDTAAIHADAVTAIKIINGAIESAKLATDAVTARAILTAAIESAKIATDAVTVSAILNAAVETSKLAVDAVTVQKILNNAVETSKLASDAITTAKILNFAVTTSKLAALAVDSSKLGALSVDSEKIAPGSVQKVALGDAAVETSKLASDSVTSTKILAGSVGANKLAQDYESLTRVASTALSIQGPNHQVVVGASDATVPFVSRGSATFYNTNGLRILREAVVENTPAMFDFMASDSAKAYWRWQTGTTLTVNDVINMDNMTVYNMGTTAGFAFGSNSTMYAPYFNGNGAALTAINGANITAGTVDTAALKTDSVTSAKLLSNSGGLTKVTGGAASVSNGNVGVGTASPASSLSIGTPRDATLSYTQIDTLNADTAGPPAAGDCDAATEVGRMIASTRYTATADYSLWVCVQTGAATYAWYKSALVVP